jgi:hypothetical protein
MVLLCGGSAQVRSLVAPARIPIRSCLPISALTIARLSLAIFFIAHLFHPGDGIAIEFFCDGGMRH